MAGLTVALTKGRLENKIIERLIKSGADVSPITERGRKLIAKTVVLGNEVSFVFAKAADVVTYVEHGVCDAGIVGKDTLLDFSRPVYEVADLGFGECGFALAAPKGTDFFGGFGKKAVATKYPAVAKRFFESRNMDVEIVRIEGSVELAPLLKLCDGIIDIVETGATLKENGLEVVEKGERVSARLIANPAGYRLKKKEIEVLADIFSKT